MSEVSEATSTRVETVTANIAAIEEKYGVEAKQTMIWACIKDISVSLAMLVDAGASSSTTTEETSPAAETTEET